MTRDKRNDRIQYTLLLSPCFLASLALLLLNDHLLKAAYPGWVTGKLSDFSGLFMFTVCLLAFLPDRQWAVGGLVAVMFAVWKSPLSGGAIQVWNEFCPGYALARVIDYTDLFALVMVPLAVLYSRHFEGRPCPVYLRRLAVVPVLGLVLFATLATSWAPTMHSSILLRRSENGAAFSASKTQAVIKQVALRHGIENYQTYDHDMSGQYWSGNQPVGLLHEIDRENGTLRLEVTVARPLSSDEKAKAFQAADSLKEDLLKTLSDKFGIVDVDVQTDQGQ